MNNYITVETKLKSKDILIAKYKFLFIRHQYGYMTGISLFGIIFYSNLLLNNSTSIDVVLFRLKQNLPGLLITLIVTIFVVIAIVKTYLDNQKEFEGVDYLEVEYFFSHYGITSKFKSEEYYNWKSIHEIIESRQFFTIYNTKTSILIVPKKDFSSNSNIVELRRIMMSKIDKKRLKLRKN